MDRTSRPNWSPLQFVLLPENRSAVLAVRRLTRRLGRCPFVPLLLVGAPGTGKSHLSDDLFAWAAARGDVIRQDSADWPPTDLGELRECDLLIVEDLQYLPARAADEFAALLDVRVTRRRATLLTAGRSPAELENLPPRLVSRTTGGLTVELEALGVNSRLRFLKKRAAACGLIAGDGVLRRLARHTPGSGRQLLAALDQLQRLGAMLPAPPDAAAVRAHFREAAMMTRPTLERILRQVGRQCQLAPRLFGGRDRQPGALWARQVSMYLAHELTELSLAQIGEFFGRDQSTVRHACLKVAQKITDDTEFATRVRELRTQLT
jgi:chromosomal replication initiator protein